MIINDRRKAYQERRLVHHEHCAVNRTTWRHTCDNCKSHIYVQYRHGNVLWCTTCQDYTQFKFDDNTPSGEWGWIIGSIIVLAVVALYGYLNI